jgi:heptaprenyl diphosphate synthase
MEEGVYTLPVLRTIEAGGPCADELSDLLGKPLDAAERDKALSIVRSGAGIQSAIDTARRFVGVATDACDRLGSAPIVDALRAAPMALLDSVAVD